MQIVTKAITAKARTITAISLKWAASTIKSTTTTRSKPQSIAILNELQQCKNDNRNKISDNNNGNNINECKQCKQRQKRWQQKQQQ